MARRERSRTQEGSERRTPR